LSLLSLAIFYIRDIEFDYFIVIS